ncbi:MAG: prepilin peptidase, partial [Myxococcales bacterium]|nr:prepilin peptidase [Myxococcales bacterium]
MTGVGLGLAFAALVFILGASIGSFLNVVIYRLPAGLSIVRPASRCPACETPIRARHNVPVLGWLMLRGRCAACGVAISARYALVELAMGVLALALFADLSGGLLTAELLVSPDFLLDVAGPFVVYLTFLAGL